MTEEEAFQKLSALCARGEHCQWEMREKMLRWQLPASVADAVVGRLVAGRYVDDGRYARAFVADKVRYDRWGRRKIEQTLRRKHIADSTVSESLSAVSDSDYAAVLAPLLRQKSRSIKASSDYERRQKLVRFALGRGYDYDVIRQCIDIDADYDDRTADDC